MKKKPKKKTEETQSKTEENLPLKRGKNKLGNKGKTFAGTGTEKRG